MKTLLWRNDETRVDDAVMRFLAGDDVALDRELFCFDIRATMAHVRGLAHADLLTGDECQAIVSALQQLRIEFESGEFALDDRFEDGHSAIETYLSERLGEIGERVHLGRSRNDQVLVATRLFMLDALRSVGELLRDAALSALARARQHEMTPMPGYTHLQRAVPSTVGLWMASFVEGFGEDAALAGMTAQWINASPLGTAAGYGVNLPLARERVAQELGFDKLQINPMHAQACRGKHEVQVLACLWQAMQDVRRLAWDLSLFSSAEFGFVRMAESTLTGSSIMPNKKNPDVAELLRGTASVVGGAMVELQQTLSLPSGYHRDLQLTKGSLLRAAKASIRALGIVPGVFEGLVFDESRMRMVIDKEMFATDYAVKLAASGISFREAYRITASDLDVIEDVDPASSVAERVSAGACANLRLDELESRIAAATGWLESA